MCLSDVDVNLDKCMSVRKGICRQQSAPRLLRHSAMGQYAAENQGQERLSERTAKTSQDMEKLQFIRWKRPKIERGIYCTASIR